MNLQLRKFDITQIKSDKVCVFIGKRETGKSFLVKDLLFTNTFIPVDTLDKEQIEEDKNNFFPFKFLCAVACI